MKERIARAKQALPNGYCGLPLVQTCPHPNACLTCESFLTDPSFRAVHEHLHRHAPWGAEVTVSRCREGEPHSIDVSGPAFEAFRRAFADTWGRAPVEPGSGGSLPLVAALAAAYPDAELLLTGVEDLESNAHSENESVHLGELRNCCVNEAMLLAHLAAA